MILNLGLKKGDGDIYSGKCSVCCKTFSIFGQDINSYSHMLKAANIKNDFQNSKRSLPFQSNN